MMYFTPKCDKCGVYWANNQEDSANSERMMLKIWGWGRVGKSDYCPTCYKRRLEAQREKRKARP